MADLRAYYEVGYVPPNPKADGRWRAISVKVSRPGVVVRTRRGYYAMPPGAPVVLPYELALAEALAASPMPRDVEHRAATLRFAGGEAETELLVWVEVPHAGLSLTRDETTYRGRVSLLGQVKDEKGTLVARLSHDAAIEGPLAEIEVARQRTTVVKRTLRLPPGRYVLETAVQDRESGRVGARRSAFEIPTPGPVPEPGQRRDRARRRGGRGRARPGRPSPGGPPPRDSAPRPVVPRGDARRLAAAEPLRRPGAARPEVELEFRRDGQAVAHAKPELPAPDAGGRVTYVGSFPTGSLAPGRYEVWVRGRLGDAEATEATAFTITPRLPLDGRAGASAHRRQERRPRPRRRARSRTGRASRRPSRRSSSGRGGTSGTTRRRSATWWPRSRTASGGPTRRAGRARWPAPSARTWCSSGSRGPLPWGTFRDVYEVDGQKVRDRERRLEKLFFAPKASEFEQAEAILNESSRYNLGRAYRNVNVPALGLLFLRPENQARLAFKRKGTRTIAGFPAVEVAFEEKASPTLVHDRVGERRAGERALLDRRDPGTVLRTEIEYDLETEKSKRTPDAWERGLVSTEYRREIGLESLRARHDDGALQLPGHRARGRRSAVLEVPAVRGLGRHGGGAASRLRPRGGRRGKDGAATHRRPRLHRARARDGSTARHAPANDRGARDGRAPELPGAVGPPAAEGRRLRRALREGFPERRGGRALRAEDLARLQRSPERAPTRGRAPAGRAGAVGGRLHDAAGSGALDPVA